MYVRYDCRNSLGNIYAWKTYEKCVPEAGIQGQGQVITSHSICEV